MKLTRMFGVLAGALATTLAVVIIRAESARIQYQLSRLEIEESALRLQLREYELETARLRSPQRVRARLVALRASQTRTTVVDRATGRQGGR